MPPMILGWDVGGAAIKVAMPEAARAGHVGYRVAAVAYEIRDDPSGLPAALQEAAARLGVDPRTCTHAVTMTAELARAFRTKGEGVAFVLDALEVVAAGAAIMVYTTEGRFVTPDEGRSAPLLVAAANWMATASLVARSTPTCMLVDIGSTSTDIIPIVEGQVVALGRTDPDRLRSGELVYSGALRTPVEALVRRVPLSGGMARVAAEGFATTADVHCWLGNLESDGVSVPTPGNHGAERAQAGDRLARVVCADRQMLDDDTVAGIARAIAEAQILVTVEALEEVRARHNLTHAVVTGFGDFIAAEACARAGLQVTWLADRLGMAARMAPAAAVATLLDNVKCLT